VALIGEQWLTISSNTGVRRLDDPRASMRNKGASLSGKFYLAALDLLFLSYGVRHILGARAREKRRRGLEDLTNR
jgi:hypothetical protein